MSGQSDVLRLVRLHRFEVLTSLGPSGEAPVFHGEENKPGQVKAGTVLDE